MSETQNPAATLEWSARMAYLVGLIATDGYISDTNTIGFSSTDPELVDLFERCIGRSAYRYSLPPEKRTPSKYGIVARKTIVMARVYDTPLRDWLLSVGVKRNKSLVLGELEVPDEFLFDLVAGLLDGDGSVMKLNAAPKGTRSEYRLIRLRLAFYSGSEPHLIWLKDRLAEFHIRGSLHRAERDGHSLYHLIYSDRQAAVILTNVYEDPRAPRLRRKRDVWEQYKLTGRQPPYYGST